MRKKNGFYGFSSGDVFYCEAMCDDVRTYAGTRSLAQSRDVSTEARRAKTLEEGFLGFLLNIRVNSCNPCSKKIKERGGKEEDGCKGAGRVHEN